jgi:hypothetical protein
MKIFNNMTLVVAMLTVAQPVLAAGVQDSTRNPDNPSSASSTGNNQHTSSNFDSSWNSQNKYWKDNYPSSSYYSSSRNYSMYEPAYRYGVDLYNRNPNMSYDQLDQAQLRSGWNSVRGTSNLDWNDAQMATKDAYTRMYNNRNSSSSSSSGSSSSSPSSGSSTTSSNY